MKKGPWFCPGLFLLWCWRPSVVLQWCCVTLRLRFLCTSLFAVWVTCMCGLSLGFGLDGHILFYFYNPCDLMFKIKCIIYLRSTSPALLLVRTANSSLAFWVFMKIPFILNFFGCNSQVPKSVVGLSSIPKMIDKIAVALMRVSHFIRFYKILYKAFHVLFCFF